jgi:predicted Zn-dependent peptidase
VIAIAPPRPSLRHGAGHPAAFSGVPIAPHTTQEIEAAVYDELERLQREPPTDYELQRVRNQVQAGAIQRLQDNFGLAFQLSNSEALWYDWRQTFRVQAALARVTAADVQRVARLYFAKTNRTVATLVRPARPDSTGGTR